MNSVKFVLTLALTAASAASCLKEAVVRGVEPGELALNPQVDALTKAPIAGTAFPNERTIVLSAYCTDASYTGEFFQGITFKREEAKGSWTGGGGSNPKYWPVTGTLDLLAYSADGFNPALSPVYNTTDCSLDVTLTVPDNSARQVDILWAGAQDKEASSTALEMVFKHAESAVAFDARSEEVPYDFAANMGITINKITLNSVKSKGTVKLPGTGDCIWSNQATPKNIELPGIPTAGYDVTAAYIYSQETKPFAIGETGLIVIPQQATSFTVNYTVHYGRDVRNQPVNKTETFTYQIPNVTWNAGSKYIYKLNFTLDEILVATDIYEWTESPIGVPVQEPVSATYKNTGSLDIDLGAATLSAGGVVGIDWGSGRRQIIENTSTSNAMTISELPHSYSSAPADSVKIYVRKGVLDFGIVSNTQYKRFHVYNSNEVKMQTKQWILALNSVANGDVTLSYPGGSIDEGQFEPVYQGETVAVNSTPDTHYVIDYIKYYDGTEHDITDAPSFTMPGASTTVSVAFKKKEYELTANPTFNGSFILKDGTNEISSGSSIVWGTTITVVPTANPGYVVDKVTFTCGGTSTVVEPASSVYKFDMPTGDTSVTVTFKIQVPGDPLDSYDIETWTPTS